jgi:hypothetical protein
MIDNQVLYSVPRIIKKVDEMVTEFIDDSYDMYKEEFEEEYLKLIEEKDLGNLIEFMCHDFLFCSILHDKSGVKYDIRQYHTDDFERLLEKNTEVYAKIVSKVDNYFKKYPDDACERLEEYKPDTILKYYAFVYTTLNLDLFVRRNCPKFLLDDNDSDTDSE